MTVSTQLMTFSVSQDNQEGTRAGQGVATTAQGFQLVEH